MTPEVVWTGTFETECIKARQRPAPPLPVGGSGHRTNHHELAARCLQRGPKSIRDLSVALGISMDKAHHAVRVLRNAGRVERIKGSSGALGKGNRWRIKSSS
jgi:hypothetical protein